MAKYRKKPIVVEASQWFPGKDVKGVNPPARGDKRNYVSTIHDQVAYLAPGDWVIAEPDGIHYYPCKPDIFATTYEPVGE